MSNKQYKVKILARYCKGCGLCVAECSQDTLLMPSHPDKDGRRVVEVRENADCSGCLKCATICPDGAIEVYEICSDEESDAGN